MNRVHSAIWVGSGAVSAAQSAVEQADAAVVFATTATSAAVGTLRPKGAGYIDLFGTSEDEDDKSRIKLLPAAAKKRGPLPSQEALRRRERRREGCREACGEAQAGQAGCQEGRVGRFGLPRATRRRTCPLRT